MRICDLILNKKTYTHYVFNQENTGTHYSKLRRKKLSSCATNKLHSAGPTEKAGNGVERLANEQTLLNTFHSYSCF